MPPKKLEREKADFLVNLYLTQVRLQSERLRLRVREAGVPDPIWFAELGMLLDAANRLGRLLKSHPSPTAGRALAEWNRGANRGVKVARDVLEHADDWLAGRGRDQPNEKAKDQTGRLHQVEALYRTGDDGAAEVLAVQLSGHGLDGGPDGFVHPDAILGSAEDAVRLL